MINVVSGALTAVAAIALVFLIACLATLVGALTGWVVGIFFADTILSTLTAFGVDASSMQMWELGATLGFVGAFFKAYTTKVSA